MDGAGGGGAGGWRSATGGTYQAAAAGVANTGGGGGGGVRLTATHYVIAASGGSGIVCFRDAQELPELAGTWVLNERLYAPESDFQEYTSFTSGPSVGEQYADKQIITYTLGDKRPLTVQRTNGAVNQLYNFNTNAWEYKYKYLVFPADATASDEFRAWLASNATKQA